MKTFFYDSLRIGQKLHKNTNNSVKNSGSNSGDKHGRGPSKEHPYKFEVILCNGLGEEVEKVKKVHDTCNGHRVIASQTYLLSAHDKKTKYETFELKAILITW